MIESECLPVGLRDRIPRDVHRIAQQLRGAGFRAWVVGGCTRDLLLYREVHDWDVATDATPQQVMKLFRRVIPTGVQHGTVTVMLGRKGYEVTTLRGEGPYSDGRHPDSVVFVSDLHQDLARRDFTINAIAVEPGEGRLIDPFDGQADLQQRVIRAVGEPAERFREDGLRLMRAARFSATLGFDIEERTRQAMIETHEMLRKVSAERVRDELLKLLASKQPSRGLQVMLDTGLLAIALPEMVPSVGCEQNRYHAYDVWTHTLVTVEAIGPDPMMRLAALLHDVGKPSSRGINPQTNDYTFYGHERLGADMAYRICERLRLSNDERARVVDVVRHHLVVYEPEWTDAAVRRWLRRVGEHRMADVLALAEADARGKGTDPADQLERLQSLQQRVHMLRQQGMALTTRDLAVNGRDLMQQLGLSPGPLVGRILEHLLEVVTDEPSANEREQLMERAREFAASQAPAAT